MKYGVSVPLLICLTCAGQAVAAQPRARTTITAPVPFLSFGFSKGEAFGFGLMGLSLGHYWSNGVFTNSSIVVLKQLTNDWGHTADISVGYRFVFNDGPKARWPLYISPQVGYRVARRPIYSYDGTGPLNRSHGPLIGLTYDLIRSARFGFIVRAHTLFEWALSSDTAFPQRHGPASDQAVFSYGVDVGFSVGVSFGH